jgi:para-aminobenzoate synthetase component 1
LRSRIFPEKTLEALTETGPSILELEYKDGRSKSSAGRHDIITAKPDFVVSCNDLAMTRVCYTDGRINDISQTPLAFISQTLKQRQIDVTSQLPFCGGFLGYISYEFGALMEGQVDIKTTPEVPLMQLGFYSWALVIDHDLRKVFLSFLPDCNEQQRSEIIALAKDTSCSETTEDDFILESKFQSSLPKSLYLEAFAKIQAYIQAGDCYQINLSQLLTARYTGSEWQAYRYICEHSPAPFGAFLKLMDDGAVLSFSPERFMQLRDNKILTQPIKGTVPRNDDPGQDMNLAQELLNSEKNRAENLMIVDLLRNDLGRVCQTGTVEVERLFELQSFSHVHHLVSTVTGKLQAHCDATDVLAATLPGGSITGAPKIRAMQIINELEPVQRSIYCGTIGFININGNMDTNIAIRSALCHKGKLYCWGGGGIVADSDGGQEFQECLDKVAGIIESLEKFSR